MHDLLQLLPIYTFMLIPVWIPLVAAAFGLLSDAITSPARVARRHGVAGRHPGQVSPAGPRVLAAETAR
ncbi:MAG TPA: hypothetical protein VNS46_10165 [Nocardioides sp.]|nr:hypothetical protein [Nocardioides sp.]